MSAGFVLITGISRSGTSYLSRLLGSHDDCVSLIDPPGFLEPLKTEDRVDGCAAYVAETRAAVRAGRPLLNKVDASGLPTEDTWIEDIRREHVHSVRTDGFVVAIKNIRMLISRVEAVREVLPDARLVLCARDPYDAIASWKRSFAHLRDADVRANDVAVGENPRLAAADRAALTAMEAVEDVAERRVRSWTWLAGRVLALREDAVLVDYEDLVRAPGPTLGRVLGELDAGRMPAPPAPSAPRRHRELLDEHDLALITEHCVPLARELGVRILPPTA